MPSVMTFHLLTLMSSLMESKLDNLREIVQASRMGLLLYRLDKELFPFYDEKSPLYLGITSQRKDTQTIDEYKVENRTLWLSILSQLSKIDVEDWSSALEDFQHEHLDAFLSHNEVSIEYFCIIFIYFVSKASPLTFKRLQIKYPEAVVSVINTASAEQSSGKKSLISHSPLSKSTHVHGNLLPPHLQQSPEQILSQFRKKDYLVTDTSIQNLVKYVSELQNEITIIREELIFKEKETFELHEKLGIYKTEKKGLKEELDNQNNLVGRLNFKLETLKRAVEQQPDNPASLSLEIANRKIEDLYTEVEHLQRKNADLEHRVHNLTLSKHLEGGQTRDSTDSETLDRTKDRIRCLQLENRLLEDKIQVLESNTSTLSDKLLKEKDNTVRVGEQLNEACRNNTQKEISLKAALNDKEAMARDNERLRDTIIEREHQLKRMEAEFNSIVRQADHHRQGSKMMASPQLSSDDANLELVKICKEVNRNYLKELNCVYGLLHDTFVSELTGTTLDELIKKRLAEANRPQNLFPL